MKVEKFNDSRYALQYVKRSFIRQKENNNR